MCLTEVCREKTRIRVVEARFAEECQPWCIVVLRYWRERSPIALRPIRVAINQGGPLTRGKAFQQVQTFYNPYRPRLTQSTFLPVIECCLKEFPPCYMRDKKPVGKERPTRRFIRILCYLLRSAGASYWSLLAAPSGGRPRESISHRPFSRALPGPCASILVKTAGAFHPTGKTLPVFKINLLLN